MNRPAPEVCRRSGRLVMAAAFIAGIGSTACIGETVEGRTTAEVVAAGDAAPVAASPSGAQIDRFDDMLSVYASDPQNSRQRKQFRDALQRVRTSYVRAVSDADLIDAAVAGIAAHKAAPHSVPSNKLVETALDAMTASLDPHSTYLDPEELKDAEQATSGSFGGLGIQVTQESDKIKVISPIEGTPADRAGLRSGDIITHVNGKAVSGMTLTQAVQAMRGPPGTRIRLTIERPGRTFTVSMTRAVIAVQAVRFKTYGDVGYLRISNFSDKAMDGVESAMRELRGKLRQPARGLIIDLRNNPGGLFEQALLVSDAFLDDGMIVAIKGRDAERSRGFRAKPGDLAAGMPIVILINGGSASASEIVAAALRDHSRAVLMGNRTFGKGSVQTVMRLPVEGALKLTTALYYAPSGQTIQGHGITPDVVLVGEEDDRGGTHEIDLPGALPGDGTRPERPSVRVDAASCPRLEQEDKDSALACAVALLRAGSKEAFLAGEAAATPRAEASSR